MLPRHENTKWIHIKNLYSQEEYFVEYLSQYQVTHFDVNYKGMSNFDFSKNIFEEWPISVSEDKLVKLFKKRINPISLERVNKQCIYAIAWVNLFSVELITYFMILANSFLFSLTFSTRIYTQLFDAEAEWNKFIEKSILALKMTFIMVWVLLRYLKNISCILKDI